ncbi:MAG: hypothetical protein VW802_14500 [Rhodospirillaceae bacterium]|jgi:uncharacterized integral membrane protein
MVQMACLVMLLGNLVGGLISTVLHAFEKPAPPRKFFEKPSARLFIIGEIVLIAFAIYFHSMVRTNFTNWDIGYWVATFLMAPLFAIVGSQISKIAFAEKLAQNKRAWNKIEAKKKAKKAAAKKKADETLSDEEANLTKLKEGDGDGTLNDVEAELTKLEDDEDAFFNDSMNISNPND